MPCPHYLFFCSFGFGMHFVLLTGVDILPNPIGLSVLEVLDVRRNVIPVKDLDILGGTPILDIKPIF